MQYFKAVNTCTAEGWEQLGQELVLNTKKAGEVWDCFHYDLF